MIKKSVHIVNKLGLHARPSAMLVSTAAKFQAEVYFTKDGLRVNGKSIMGVMMLAAGKGARVVLETDGADEVEALEALVGLIEDYFGEGG